MKLKKLALTLTASLTLICTSGVSNAQGLRFWEYFNTSEPQQPRYSSHQNRGMLNRTVSTLDSQSHQMYNEYGYQVRHHPKCPHVKALYSQMRLHSGTCDALVKASKGACLKTFKTAAINTKNSATRIVQLSKYASVANSTRYLIGQTNENAVWVVANADRFRPVIPAPVYDPVYINISSKIKGLPMMSNQLVSLYSAEAHCGCKNAMALLASLKKYHNNVLVLDRAYKGTCAKTFKTAACDARKILDVVQVQSKTVELSCQVSSLIRNSCPPLTYIHKNSSHFQPYQPAFASGGHRRASGPRYTQTGW